MAVQNKVQLPTTEKQVDFETWAAKGTSVTITTAASKGERREWKFPLDVRNRFVQKFSDLMPPFYYLRPLTKLWSATLTYLHRIPQHADFVTTVAFLQSRCCALLPLTFERTLVELQKGDFRWLSDETYPSGAQISKQLRQICLYQVEARLFIRMVFGVFLFASELFLQRLLSWATKRGVGDEDKPFPIVRSNLFQTLEAGEFLNVIRIAEDKDFMAISPAIRITIENALQYDQFMKSQSAAVFESFLQTAATVSVSPWPEILKRKFFNVVHLFTSSSAGTAIENLVSAGELNAGDDNLLPEVGNALDLEMAGAISDLTLASLNFGEEMQQATLSGFHNLLKYSRQIQKVLLRTGLRCDTPPEQVKFTFLEVVQSPPLMSFARMFWFLRSLLMALSSLEEETTTAAAARSLNAPLSETQQLLETVEEGIWEAVLDTLKLGPVPAKYAESASETFHSMLNPYDSYLIFFSFLLKWFEFSVSRITAGGNAKGWTARLGRIHATRCFAVDTLTTQMQRWGRNGATLATQEILASKNEAARQNLRESWAKNSTLGRVIAEVMQQSLPQFLQKKSVFPNLTAPTQKSPSEASPLVTPNAVPWITQSSDSSLSSSLSGIIIGTPPKDGSASISLSSSSSSSAKNSVLALEGGRLIAKPAALAPPPTTAIASSLATPLVIQNGKVQKKQLPLSSKLGSVLGSLATSNAAAISSNSQSLASKILGRNVPKSKFKFSNLTNSAEPKNDVDVAREMVNNWKREAKSADADKGGGSRKAVALVGTGTLPKGHRGLLLEEDPNRSREAILVDMAKRKTVLSAEGNGTQFKKMSAEEKQNAQKTATLGVNNMIQQILGWDFTNLDSHELPELQNLPDRLPREFRSEEDFRGYFRPLVLEECRCSILQERMERKLEGFPVVMAKVQTSANLLTGTVCSGRKRHRGDGTLDANSPAAVSLSFDEDSAANQEILKMNSHALESLPLRLHDLVLFIPCESVLKTQNPYDGKSLIDLRGPPEEGYFLAVVDKTEQDERRPDQIDPSRVKVRFPREVPKGVTGEQQYRLGGNAVSIGSSWLVFPLASLTTSVREFQSLFTACFSPCFKFMLCPSEFGVRACPRNPEKKIAWEREVQKKLQNKRILDNVDIKKVATVCTLNKSQELAVKHALTADYGVALLQGPPGTGKTKTLLAILASIFANAVNSAKVPVKKTVPQGKGGIAVPTIKEGRPASSNYLPSTKKILVCAPSNAAVDEIAARVLLDGLPCVDGSGEVIRPICLRVGNVNRITRTEVKAISLEDHLGEESASIREKKREETNAETSRINTRLNEIEEELKSFVLAGDVSMETAGPGSEATIPHELRSRYSELQVEKRQLITRRRVLRENFSEDLAKTKQRSKDATIRNADIYFATLSGSASDLLTGVQFEYAIVDEAAQAVELSGLIPLRHEVAKVVLIGDPQQLPATVISLNAKKFSYERSLFQRLQVCGTDVVMLETQYRMRPEISEFPSKHFYQSLLKNDVSTVARPPLPFHCELKALFGPFKFFDVPSIEKRHSVSQSLSNRDEAAFIVQLVCLAAQRYVRPDGAPADGQRQLLLSDFAVVTPYKQQMVEIQMLLRAQTGQYLSRFSQAPLEICTIDSFQGREKKIIIFSCVRSLEDAADSHWSTQRFDVDDPMTGREKKEGGSRKIGFVADIRRLNVAITRARDALWIIGNSKTLKTHSTWRELIDFAKKPATITSVPQSTAKDSWALALDDATFVDVNDITARLNRSGIGGGGGDNWNGEVPRVVTKGSVLEKFFRHVCMRQQTLQQQRSQEAPPSGSGPPGGSYGYQRVPSLGSNPPMRPAPYSTGLPSLASRFPPR